MANPYIGWVNLQLVAVRHHLNLLLEEKNANERLRNRGVLESAAWHLDRAYRYYLYELGANYQLKEPELNRTANELGNALEAIGKHPGEAAELSTLEKNGWVADLKQVLGSVEQLDSGPREQKNSIPAGELTLVDVSDEQVELSAETLATWLGNFKELTTRHREVMVEY